MNRAGLFQAMEINPPRQKEPTMAKIRVMPMGMGGRGHSYNRKATIGYTPGWFRPKTMSEVNDYSTRRGVLPCYNINRFVLRNPPEFGKTHGLVPQGGQSRTQNPSLVNPRPLNLPIHIPRSNVNAALPSSIPIPGIY